MATFKRRVAYLKSTGTQWINTGVAPDFAGGDEIEIRYQVNDAVGSKVVFGSRTASVTDGVYATGNGLVFADGSSYTSFISLGIVDTTLVVNDSNIIRNGTTYETPKHVTCAFNMFLFALNNGGNVYGIYDDCQIFEWTYRHNNVMVQHLVSALDTDNIPCMYDTVSKTCFYNQGTDVFKYGELPEYITSISHPMNVMGIKKSPYFTIDLDITSDNLQFGVTPYWNAGGYCKIIDWGDGNSTDATTSGTALTHTYPVAGKYRVKVIGSMYRFRVGSTNPDAVINANGNWSALGDITDGTKMFYELPNATLAFTDLPKNLQIGYYMFFHTGGILPIKKLPDSLTNGEGMFYELPNATLNLTAPLPDGLTNIYAMFRRSYNIKYVIDRFPAGLTTVANSLGYMCQSDSNITIKLNDIVANSSTPFKITRMEYWALNTNCSGSISGFMCNCCPNVFNVASAFVGTDATTFGSNDYFSITLTTTSANFVWGFTPYSSTGRWYCFDWGDNTPITENKNLDVFTNNTRITHTFATPGTYTIKLAMNADTIEFDAYDSDNGAFDMLGNPVINGALNTTMNFISYDPDSEEILIGNEIEQDDDTIEIGGGG